MELGEKSNEKFGEGLVHKQDLEEAGPKTDGRFSIPGGDGIQLQNLARAFEDAGHRDFTIEDGQIIFGHGHVPHSDEVSNIQQNAGIEKVIFSAVEEPS